MKIGDGKFGGEKKTYFKLKDGDSVFRIVPALGDLAADGVWSKYYKIHYGYRNTKGHMRVFQSSEVKNNKTKMIEIPDKALERIQKLKAELEKAKEAKNAPMIERLMKLVGGQKAMYNMDSHHYMNAIDTQGNIGILKIRHKAKQALDLAIKKLRDAGINPISVENGRYFVFSRTGKGLDTTFQVTVAKESMDVPGIGKVERDIIHKLTNEVILRLEREAAVSIKEKNKKGGLDSLFFAPTADQVDQIVSQSDILTGKSPAVDLIFDTKADASVTVDDSGDEDVTETTDTETQAASTPAPTVTTQAAPTPEPTPTPAVAQAPVTTPQTQQPAPQASPTPSEKPTQAAAAPSAPSPAQTTAQAVAAISDDDFLASLNNA